MNGLYPIRFTLDGRAVTLEDNAPPVLADALKACGAPGVRVSCDHGVCGTCTVKVDGRLASSCSMLTHAVAGRTITTAASSDAIVQQAFIEARAFQCGMCTPGMMALAESLLARHSDPSPAQVRQWMSANVCRCTGYAAIEAAVLLAAERKKTGATQAVARREDLAKVRGEPMFTMDMTLPDTAEIKILRSPHAHARIVRIDLDAARAIEGVHAIVTGEDVAALAVPNYGLWIKDQPVLAIDRVRYIGDPVAAVAACSPAIALAAIAAIVVEYVVLETVSSPEAALAPGAPTLFDTPSNGGIPKHGRQVETFKEPAPNVLYEFRHRIADCDAIFATADHVFEDSFSFSRMSHVHLEPIITLARPLGDGVEVWSCNQDPFLLRQDIGEIFGIPEQRVRVHTTAIGGGFGAKSFCKVEPIAVLLALRAQRAVRLSLSMDESFLTLSQHAAMITLTTAVTSDGTLLARRADIVLDGGAYADASALVADKVGYRIGGPYRWAALDSRARSVRTNTVPAGSFRGFGGTQASWASESQIDMIARRLGIDPVALRQANLLRPGEPFRPGDSTIDCDLAAGLRTVVEKMTQTSGATPAPAVSATSRPSSRRGTGVAIGFKDAGGQGRYAQARVKVTSDGHALIGCATVDMGQGAVEAFRRIVSDVLQLDPSRIERSDIDTDQTAFDQGTHASSGTAVTGEAVRRAAVAVRERILSFAAQRLSCSPADLAYEQGNIIRSSKTAAMPTVLSTGTSATEHINECIEQPADALDIVSLHSLVRAYYGGLGTEFTGEGEVKIEADENAALNAPIVYWMPNWVGAEVDVDTETGRITLLKLVTAADAGRALVPSAVKGQIEGAALQGIGQAFFEQLHYDGASLVNGTPQRYRVPLASDLPGVFEAVVLEHGMGRGPFGAKGVGEAGILGLCAAVANAVEDAAGIRLTELPMTPDKVLAALASVNVRPCRDA